MKFIAVINGPNLNLLGVREPHIYGKESFEDYLDILRKKYEGINIQYFQSNIEGELINELQKQGLNTECIGIVLNAGGYAHTSIAIADAIASINAPVIAVHISNMFSREVERRTDLVASKCLGMICGLGLNGYSLAIQGLL